MNKYVTSNVLRRMKEKYTESEHIEQRGLVHLGGQGRLPGRRMTFRLRSEKIEVNSAL